MLVQCNNSFEKNSKKYHWPQHLLPHDKQAGNLWDPAKATVVGCRYSYKALLDREYRSTFQNLFLSPKIYNNKADWN